MIDTMIREYKDLAAHINQFKTRWYDNVVAVEGGLHLTPASFSALCVQKQLFPNAYHSTDCLHLCVEDGDIRYLCVISGEFVPPKEEAA